MAAGLVPDPRVAGAASLRAALATAPDLATAIDLTLDFLLSRQLPMPSLYLARGDRLRCLGQRGYWHLQDGLPVSEGVAGQTYRSGKPTRVLAAEAAEFIAAVPGIAEEVCAPIRVGNEVVGVLNAESMQLLPDDALPIIEECAGLFGERLAALGGPPVESVSDQFVRHAARLAGMDRTDDLWGYVQNEACRLAGMPSCTLIDLGLPGGAGVVSTTGTIGTRLCEIPAQTWETIADQVSWGTSCHTSGSKADAPFQGYQALRAVGALALIIVPIFADGLARALLICAGESPADPDSVLVERLELLGAQAGNRLQTLRALAELRELAMRDPLTGLGNRTWFLGKVRERLSTWSEAGTGQFAVMFCDLDGFKDVNDSLGHAAGDQLLVTVADRMGARLGDGDLLARLGGDEFAFCWDRFHTVQDAINRAAELPDLLARPVDLDGIEVSVRGSVGIALANRHGADPPDALTLLREADAAMYEAKRRRRSGVALFTDRLRSSAADRLHTAAGLRRAVDDDQLVMRYQPIVSLTSGAFVGMEALLRWQHPERGLLVPAEFIPIAEDTGAILVIGAWALQEGCAQLARWDRLLPRAQDLRLGINVSARQLLDPALPEILAEALSRSGTAAQRIVLEITESTLMEDVDATQAVFAALHDLGVRIAVDDFGTGFSSLAYLKRFSVDILKIDRSFVHELTQDAEVGAIVAAIIGMAKALGLDVVAEGVETAAQRHSLTALGCPNAQGYLFAAPGTAQDMLPLIASAPANR